VQPGKLAINEAFGAGAHCCNGLGLRFLFLNYNGLFEFHQILVHPGGGSAIPNNFVAKHVLSQ
jgi:hypothetical protein